MDIVVLDGYCLNHGDLSWAPFERLGNVAVYERTPYGEIASRMGGASVMITNKCNVDRTVVDALPNLKYVGVLATGYNNVDTEYCREKGIAVTNVPSYSTESVVQAVFGLTLQLYSGLSTHAASVKRGDWCAAPDFCYYLGSLRELYGKTLGIVGFGAIGSLFPPTWDWYMFWKMTAFLSIILAFMNILPIPALDGGHVLFLLYEMITRRKPSENFMIRAEYVGFAILILLMLVANLNDILRWLGYM